MTCSKHFTPTSSSPGYKPWCHEETNAEMSAAIIWSSEVYILLPTCHPSHNKILGIREFVTLLFWNLVVILKDKHTVLCVHAMKAHRVSKGIAPLIFNLSTRWRWVVIFMLQLFYHRHQLNTRLDGPQRESRHFCGGEKFLVPSRNRAPDHPASC
jgi:hypothetical protein